MNHSLDQMLQDWWNNISKEIVNLIQSLQTKQEEIQRKMKSMTISIDQLNQKQVVVEGMVKDLNMSSNGNTISK